MINILARQIDKTTLNKVTILDVRTKEEFDDGHISNAKNIPIDEIVNKTSTNPDKLKPLLIYCESGARSQLACQILDQQGFQTYNLVGGYTAWLANK